MYKPSETQDKVATAIHTVLGSLNKEASAEAALKYSQAALNLAHTVSVLENVERAKQKPVGVA